jgi:hypothetical protein
MATIGSEPGCVRAMEDDGSMVEAKAICMRYIFELFYYILHEKKKRE